MKKCPYCAEDIQNAAKKCRYCGEWLSKKTKISPIKSFVKSAKKLKKDKSSKELPMKWYWFMIYIGFPLSFIMTILSLALFEGIGLEISEGIVFLFILQILSSSISWYGLYKKFDWSWKFYIGIISFNSIVTSIFQSEGSIVGFLILSAFVLFVYVYPQYVYFKKRNHLFFNSSSLGKPKKEKSKKNAKEKKKQSESESIIHSIIGVSFIFCIIYLSYINDPYTHLNKGNEYFEQENYIQAKKSYNKAIELDSDFGMAYYNLSLCYYQEDDRNVGVIFMKRAAELGFQRAQDYLKEVDIEW